MTKQKTEIVGKDKWLKYIKTEDARQKTNSGGENKQETEADLL